MSSYASHHRSPSPLAAETEFLPEARHNLRLMRHLYSVDHCGYRRLVRQYRYAADLLGCRRSLERVLHPLRRRPRPEMGAWHPSPSHSRRMIL